MTLRKFLRIVKWSALGVFLFILAIISSISTVVFTEPGSRWAVTKVFSYLPIDIGEIHGNLLTGLDLGYIDYRIEENGELQQRYRADNVSFRWQPLALFYSAVSVQSLRADTIRVLLPPITDAEPQPAQWPSFALPVRIELGQVQLDDIRVERSQADLPPQLLVELRSVSSDTLSLGTFNFRLTDLAVVAPDYAVTASGRIGLRYPYDARLNVQWQFQLPASEEQPEPLLLSGNGDITGNIEQLELTHALHSPMAVESVVQITPNLSQPPAAIAQIEPPLVDALNKIPEQPLPSFLFPAEAAIPVVAGELQLTGWLDDYQALLNGQVNYADLPPVAVTATTRGDLSQLQISDMLVQLQDAADQRGPTQAQLAGSVAWSPEVRWDLTVNSADLDPARYLAEWPGRLQLALRTTGSIAGEQGLRVAVQDLLLEGRLRAFDVRAEGAVEFDGQRWESEQLVISLGANHLRLQGSMSDSFDVQWYLNAPLLNQIDPALQGNVFTQGHLLGTPSQPNLQMELRADSLQWQAYAVRQLNLTLTQIADNYQLRLAAEDIALDQQRISNLNLDGSGNLAQHQLHGVVNSEQFGTLELALDSGYRDDTWQGQFTQFYINLPSLPRWWLLRSQPMRATAGNFDLGELCLTTRSGAWRGEQNPQDDSAAFAPERISTAERETPAICTQAQWQRDTGTRIDGTLAAVPLRQLRAFLKPDVAVTGVIEGNFSVNLPVDQAPTAQAQIQTREGELHYQYADQPLEVYRWESAVVTAGLKNQLLTAKLVNNWGEFGDIEGDVSLNTENQQLKGKMHINFRDLAPLAAFMPFADDISGNLAADLELRGTTADPQILGQLNLSGGEAKIPRLGLDLRDMGLTLNTYGNGRIDMRASARSGEGSLRIAGELEDLGTPDWQLSATAEGERFLVIQQPQLAAQISPNMKLIASQQEVRLTGDALIPSARADIKTLPPTAIRVSNDVVIEEAGRANGRDDEIAFYMNINAELGDDVRFSGFGLTSRLAGRMSLIKTATRPLLATGYVDVVDGKYRAYGQELVIDRGRLIFQGPYDNPGLDIRAQRTLRGSTDSIVGLAIGGTLQRPTSEVYSDPPLEHEGEAMALLLTGKPLAEASAGDAYAIVSAMSGLGMDEGGGITSQIAGAFSLDEFRISAEDGFEHSSLWLGKYLTERLFVRYIVGLFDQVNKVGVSYQMTDRLRIEAESGLIQSVDMIYKIDR